MPIYIAHPLKRVSKHHGCRIILFSVDKRMKFAPMAQYWKRLASSGAVSDDHDREGMLPIFQIPVDGAEYFSKPCSY
jgi:hypothetical protein